jgi:hypothetical protein
MTFTGLARFFSALLDFLSLFARSEREKDLPDPAPPSAASYFATDSNSSPWSFLVGGSVASHVGWQTGSKGHKFPRSAQPKPPHVHA